jgi:quinol-cytochrome oxidoreductase complex cytochrome b subunit
MADMTFMMILFIILAVIGVFVVMYVKDANAASSCGHDGSYSSMCSKNNTPLILPFP